jgi:hypothetical protein
MLALVSSCGETPKGKKEKSPNTGDDIVITQQDEGDCKSTRVLDIARDGKTIISYANEMDSFYRKPGILSWDINSKLIKAQYASSLKFEKTSPNGDYFLRRVSDRRYQLLGFRNNRVDYSAIIPIHSLDKAQIDFSQDSKYLMIKTTPYDGNGMNQFDIFDIQRRAYYKSFRAHGIKFMKMTNKSQYIVMGYDNGYEKFITMYSLNELTQIFKVKLPRFGNFTFLESAMNRIIIKSDRDYFAFDTTTGAKVFSGNFEFFHDISHNGRYALVSKNLGAMSILDTQNGEYLHTGSIPTQAELSSCQLVESPIRLVCKDKVNVGNVFVFNVETREGASVCI